MSESRRLAAVDIGTVTTRLLVADVDGDSITEIERSTDITHLGEGLTETGRLSTEAMARVADVISGYVERCKELGVEGVSAVATSASRDAANGEEFEALLASRGMRPEIIAGKREAELSFRGAAFERRGDGLLVVDCGGGSTELILGDSHDAEGSPEIRVTAARSLDVGSRRMSELFLTSDPPTPGEMQEARSWAAGEFRPFFDMLDDRPCEFVGVAGTATSLAAIEQELVEYDSERVHGYVVSGSALSDMLEMLAAMPLAKRREVVGLHPARAGVIVAGALILETVLALSGLDSMTVSEHDILYGILLDTYRDLRE